MRTRELFCDNWRFHRGDIHVERPKDKGPVYTQSKTERYRMGTASLHFNDTPDSYLGAIGFARERWEYVRLPHDYVVEGTPCREENNALGYLAYDNAWYRKRFFLPEEDEGKRLILEFEGVSGASTVYLNGCLMKRNFCGYTESW